MKWWEKKLGSGPEMKLGGDPTPGKKPVEPNRTVDDFYTKRKLNSMGANMSYPYRTLENPSYENINIEVPTYHEQFFRSLRMEKRLMPSNVDPKMMQTGGQYGPTKPLKISDRKEYERRQQAYSDSLSLYNNYQKEFKRGMDFMNEGTRVYNENKYFWEDPSQGFGAHKIPLGRINSTSFMWESANNDKIKPISSEKWTTRDADNNIITEDDGGRSYRISGYKEPVQPVVYQQAKPKAKDLSEKNLEEYNKKYPPIYLEDPNDPRIGGYAEKGNAFLYKKPVPQKPSYQQIPTKQPSLISSKLIPTHVNSITQYPKDARRYTAGDYLESQGKPSGYINMGDNTGRKEFADSGVRDGDPTPKGGRLSSQYMDDLSGMNRDSIINPRYPQDTDAAMTRLEEMHPNLNYKNDSYNVEQVRKAQSASVNYLNYPMVDQKRLERESRTVAAEEIVPESFNSNGYFRQPTKMDNTGLTPEVPSRYKYREPRGKNETMVYQNGGQFPQFQLGTTTGGQVLDMIPSTAYNAGPAWGHMLPEVRVEENMPLTSQAYEGNLKRTNPIAYAAIAGPGRRKMAELLTDVTSVMPGIGDVQDGMELARAIKDKDYGTLGMAAAATAIPFVGYGAFKQGKKLWDARALRNTTGTPAVEGPRLKWSRGEEDLFTLYRQRRLEAEADKDIIRENRGTMMDPNVKEALSEKQRMMTQFGEIEKQTGTTPSMAGPWNFPTEVEKQFTGLLNKGMSEQEAYDLFSKTYGEEKANMFIDKMLNKSEAVDRFYNPLQGELIPLNRTKLVDMLDDDGYGFQLNNKIFHQGNNAFFNDFRSQLLKGNEFKKLSAADAMKRNPHYYNRYGGWKH